MVSQQELQTTFEKIHQGGATAVCPLSDRFLLQKYEQPLKAFNTPPQVFDLVYFDAFAPSKQPAMWEFTLLHKVWQMMKNGGIMVTYCAQGRLKHQLRALGMDVETIPGPPGKREMTSAQKKNSV
ncbi:MAG: MnmC family methyltransferase [Bacteroidota bacterium]